MNKKIIKLTSIFPLLASCHGNFIDIAHAKNILVHLNNALVNEESEDYLKEEDYSLNKFTFSLNSYQDGFWQETKRTFDNSSLFYSEYRLEKTDDEKNMHIIEERHYLVEDESSYYVAIRENGEKSETGTPIYKTTKYHYENKDNMYKDWKEFVDSKKSDNRGRSRDAVKKLNEMLELIEEDNGIYVHANFQSMNSNSLYINANYDDLEKVHHETEISISNYHVDILFHRISETNYSEMKIDYEAKVDRLEPNLSASHIITIEK